MIETQKWRIKIFAPPREHPPAHVNVISKIDRAEVRISLVTFDQIGKTDKKKKDVKEIIKLVEKYYEELFEIWEALHVKI